jgi:hypothetical protein
MCKNSRFENVTFLAEFVKSFYFTGKLTYLLPLFSRTNDFKPPGIVANSVF